MFVGKGALRYYKNMDEPLNIKPPAEEMFRLDMGPNACLTLPSASEIMEGSIQSRVFSQRVRDLGFSFL